MKKPKEMKRTCYWCKKPYDARTGSSVWCEANPHRGRGARRIKKRIVTIGVMMLQPNPWDKRTAANAQKA